jgi:integrase
MSLFKRGNVWWSRVMIDGEVTVQSLKTRNKADAQAFEAIWRADRLRGEHGLTKAPTLSEFATRFINFLPGRVKRSSYAAYVSRYAALLEFKPLADCTLDKIDAGLIEQFRATQRVKPSTVNARLRCLRRALKLAQEWNLIRRAQKISMLTGEHQREYVLSETVLQKFLDRAPTAMHRALWTVLADTGLRIGEACALTWADIEGNPATAVQVRKGKTKYARRRVPVTKRASAALESLRRASGPVFYRGHGRSVTQHWCNTPFVAIRKELGLPADCTTHALRHSFLTRLGDAGASPFALQRIGGHSNISMTARYSHPDDEQLDAAIALLD